MSSKAIRVNDKVLENLKIIKNSCSSSSLGDTVAKLVHEEMLKFTAFTDAGYLPIGVVVKDTEDVAMVIKDIVNDKVIFSDGSYIFNGGETCRKLVKLSDNVSCYSGRVYL